MMRLPVAIVAALAVSSVMWSVEALAIVATMRRRWRRPMPHREGRR